MQKLDDLKPIANESTSKPQYNERTKNEANDLVEYQSLGPKTDTLYKVKH